MVCHGRDRGSAAAEFTLVVGLIVMPVLMVVMSVPQWMERSMVATTAAQQAALAAAIASDVEHGRQVAVQTAANYDVPADDVQVEMDADLARDGQVTVTVTVVRPVLSIPFVGELSGGTTSDTHTEMLSPYRSIDPGQSP